jgi:hypothetical protein
MAATLKRKGNAGISFSVIERRRAIHH